MQTNIEKNFAIYDDSLFAKLFRPAASSEALQNQTLPESAQELQPCLKLSQREFHQPCKAKFIKVLMKHSLKLISLQLIVG